MKTGRVKMSKEYYYYITRGFEELINIRKVGLKSSSDGYIHVITNKEMGRYVAESQLHTFDDYGLVRINPKGITGVVEEDDEEEFVPEFQSRIKQDFIEPIYLRVGNMYHGKNCRWDKKEKEFLCPWHPNY
jgi:hypothetical protein